MTLRYRTYGLSLVSNRAIPGLYEALPPSASPDVCLELGPEPAWVRAALRLPGVVLRSLPACEETKDPAFVLTSFGEEEFFQLYYSDGSRFLVDEPATRIWGVPGPCQTIEDLSTYLLGPIMGYVLRRRGVTALHASAFRLDGKAVVLTGPAGAGKSTLAAALALRGASILCEDIAAIKETEGEFHVQPGYSRVCLWPESVAMLMGRADALPLITPNWEKRYLALDGVGARLESAKRPLAAVYILAAREAADAPRVEDVRSPSVLVELVQNTYMNWLLDRRQRAEEFELLSRLVSQVPVRRLVPHQDPSRIGALCDLIVNHALRLSTNRASLAATASR